VYSSILSVWCIEFNAYSSASHMHLLGIIQGTPSSCMRNSCQNMRRTCLCFKSHITRIQTHCIIRFLAWSACAPKSSNHESHSASVAMTAQLQQLQGGLGAQKFRRQRKRQHLKHQKGNPSTRYPQNAVAASFLRYNPEDTIA